jgi:hypothetical protein
MRKSGVSLLCLVCLSMVSGCGSETTEVAPVQASPAPLGLGDSIDVSLADLLTKPRIELAALCQEWEDKAIHQEKGLRQGHAPYSLLPTWRLPLIVPAWREARFSEALGFSIPPYHAQTDRDSTLALHLARFGDLEAALKLVEPNDAKTMELIEACKYEKNYPVEWTRLAGLMLHVAQQRLASDDLDGGTEVVQLHKQLGAVLDDKAKQGPLGAELLWLGHRTLNMAANAWRAAKRDLPAEHAEAALKDWGSAPKPAPAVALGTSQADIVRKLRSPAQGRAVAALAPQRAFDLFVLPGPLEGAQAVVACFDQEDRLVEVTATYRARLGDTYLEPANLARFYENASIPGTDTPQAGGLHGRIYRTGGAVLEFNLISGSNTLGGLVRWRDERPAAAPALSRDFGALRLDRSFEQNRVRVAPEAQGTTIEADQAAALAQIKSPVTALALARATLIRDARADLLSGFTLRFAGDETAPPAFHQFAVPLWSAFGPARIEGVSNEQGSALTLAWEDASTRCVLRLPSSGNVVAEFDARDTQSPANVQDRLAKAKEIDKAEREARFAAKEPLTRIQRSVEAGWSLRPLKVELGMSRDQVRQSLPGGGVVIREFAQGFSVSFIGEPARAPTFLSGQALLRFDAAGRLGEVRALYQGGPVSKTPWTKHLLNELKKSTGASTPVAARWSTMWAEAASNRPTAAAHFWQDDRTWMSYQYDQNGAELVLHDCPADQPAGVFLGDLDYLPHGPEGCHLGAGLKETLQRWGITKPAQTADGGVILPITQPGPYDTLLVYFQNDQAARIVARHTAGPAKLNKPAPAGQALLEAWGRDIPRVGWPQHREFFSENVPHSFGWIDDLTRIRTFWEETNTGEIRLFTEWKTAK